MLPITGLTNIEPTMASKWHAEYYLAPFKAGAAALGLHEIDAPVQPLNLK